MPRKPHSTPRRTSTSSTDAASQATPQRPRRARATSPAPAAGTLTLSPTAAALVAKVEAEWELMPAVRALLILAGEAMTKAEQLEQITAAEGMTIPDRKGACKVHPAALLARDYRGQASGALQRLLNHLA